jgi:hypothetical protein
MVVADKAKLSTTFCTAKNGEGLCVPKKGGLASYLAAPMEFVAALTGEAS